MSAHPPNEKGEVQIREAAVHRRIKERDLGTLLRFPKSYYAPVISRKKRLERVDYSGDIR
jgi:hypothetical protein